MESTDDTAAVGIDEIFSRAWTDPDYKRRLLADPKSVIEQTLGVTLPEDVAVHVHEETETQIHLVLPRPLSS